VSEKGALDWLCLPRPDGEPVFGRLLDEDGGHFSITIANCSDKLTFTQTYLHNTNVLQTKIKAEDGSAVLITDFCPRFEQHGRIYRPISIFRIVEPISGSPTIRVSFKPVQGWSKKPARSIRGNSHLRYEFPTGDLRLTTSMPLTYLEEESLFSLKEKTYFGLTWGIGIEDDLVKVSESFLAETISYWRLWVKHCSIPTLYQKETIRSALALKLHCYEDTGAILAALTTSLPEEVGSERNWDYRFCWLRDAYYVLTAFHNLGHFEEMEGFLKFLLNIALRRAETSGRLRPVYNLSGGLPLPERSHESWTGFRGSRPVRSNNQAAEHVQNDVYGEMVLTLSPIFFDERFVSLRTQEHEELLESLALDCSQNISQPDAGLWEVRNGWQEHSFPNLMCWAGLERVRRIQEAGYLKGISFDVPSAEARARQSLLNAVVEGSLRNGPKDFTFDSSLAQLAILRFPDPDLAKKTLDQIVQSLALTSDSSHPAFFYRYMRDDDFGKPKSAFVVCSFWIAQSLAAVGKVEQARELMRGVMASANRLGLYAEHFDPRDILQSGNFPQAYSHVGQINAAFAVSPSWANIL
jgi:GH15 family glucan-1,4-alpha-glucosidase